MARFVFEDETPAAPVSRFVFEDAGEAQPAPGPGLGASVGRAAAQGATLRFGDEIQGAIQAVLPPPGGDPRGYFGGMGARYRGERDAARSADERARDAHPGASAVAELAASLPLAIASGGVGAARAGAGLGARMLAGAKTAAPLGAAYGAGASEADSLGGVAQDTALGGALSGVLGAVGPAVGAGARRILAPIARKGKEWVAKGAARAAQQGAEEASAPVRSLEGAARERAANAYRQMERIELALSNPATPAAERAALVAFKNSPEYADLVAANVKGILSAAPDALAEREAASAIAQQARADLPQAIQSRTAELLTPQAKADVLSFLKSYAEPLAWGLGAERVADWAGADPQTRAAAGVIAGAIGGRTRAGKALKSRLTRPAHQAAIGRAMERIGSPPTIPPSASQAAAVNLSPRVLALLKALRGQPGVAPAAAEEDR